LTLGVDRDEDEAAHYRDVALASGAVVETDLLDIAVLGVHDLVESGSLVRAGVHPAATEREVGALSPRLLVCHDRFAGQHLDVLRVVVELAGGGGHRPEETAHEREQPNGGLYPKSHINSPRIDVGQVAMGVVVRKERISCYSGSQAAAGR
jgi:hypothetical protein